MFSVICGPHGAAPSGPHHGHVTFDFDQSVHPAFLLLGAGGGGGAPPGCCLALTMSWIRNWGANAMGAYWPAVTVGPGLATVLANTVAVFGPPGPWHATTNVLMAGFGRAPVPGGIVAGPPWVGGAAALPGLIAHPYTILVASGPAGAHAVGVKRVGPAVFFFDPNHGELHFGQAADFANWFYGGGYSHACLTPVVGGVAPAMHRLQFN